MAYEAEVATLHQAANDTRSTRTEVDGDLRKLWGVVDNLAMAWKGGASTGFQQLMQRWNEDTEKLLKSLDDIGDMLQQTGTATQANDDEQQQMLNRYNSAL